MSNLQQTINDYFLDTENAEKNYLLGMEYFNIGQTASASTYFLRAAERTENKTLAYECLLKVAQCYLKQNNRNVTVRSCYKNALTLLPDRPEAYFLLSQHFEWITEYADSYVYADIALKNCNFNLEPLRSYVGYPGKYGFIYEKAVSGWWWGKPEECRKLLRQLADEYSEVMEESHRKSVQDNLTRLGIGPTSISHVNYNKEYINKLKFKFKDCENIEKNYSQVYQDMFVLSCLNGKSNGTYLEIGSAGPFFGNNTALLEERNWTGIGIEYDFNLANQYNFKRKNKTLCQNALETDYNLILENIAVDGVVDYLQLDCEPSETTYRIMEMIPFDKYKFAVITYEHDHYIDMTKLYRQKSREFLKSKGYELVVNDVSPDGISTFEDWWVHPDLVDREIIEKMKSDINNVTNVVNHFIDNNI